MDELSVASDNALVTTNALALNLVLPLNELDKENCNINQVTIYALDKEMQVAMRKTKTEIFTTEVAAVDTEQTPI